MGLLLYILPNITVGVSGDQNHKGTGHPKLGEKVAKIYMQLKTNRFRCDLSVYSCISFSTANPWTYLVL